MNSYWLKQRQVKARIGACTRHNTAESMVTINNEKRKSAENYKLTEPAMWKMIFVFCINVILGLPRSQHFAT